MTYKSPEVKDMTIEGRVAIVTMDTPYNPGLTSYGKEILNFQIAGNDKRFFPAKAAIYLNKIYVFSPRVEKPVSVRYCFDNGLDTEIFTTDGLPLSSFRTDNW